MLFLGGKKDVTKKMEIHEFNQQKYLKFLSKLIIGS